MDGTVLVADDDQTIRTVLTQALTRSGCKVHATSSLTTLMRWIDEGKGDLVISDVVMPDGNGLEMLPKISKDRPDLPVIVISARNTIMTAIQAAEADAYDYLPKPFDLPDLMQRSARALNRPRTLAPHNVMEEENARPDDLPLIGQTSIMQQMYRLIARIMNVDFPVLLYGESGTGKSLVARAIHDFSDRRTLPYVAITASNMQSLEGPAQILAQAKSGTILIDEVSDFDQESQARIVRMMDTPGEHAPRFMATSQSRLCHGEQANQIRHDLYFRLSATQIPMPPLRARLDDIPLLAEHFLRQLEPSDVSRHALSKEALDYLRRYSWPGNVRQLENAVRRLVITCHRECITADDVQQFLSDQPNLGEVEETECGEQLASSAAVHINRYFDLHGNILPPPGLYNRVLREVEKPLIEIALDATNGNQAKCAYLLGINRNTLRKKINDLEIKVLRSRKLD
ncbi:MAG: response regulator [Aestuariivita sp.]|nr:response regulator [Aestuariivita sp.]MCY4202658.1 response regulator [Aestuariivita sp.]MCY4288481.1 response regulator [Aestuariivita sp.]MCY4347065.1 response regulator [Aestuariivita sp.]